MKRALNLGPGKGTGKVITIRGEVPGLAIYGAVLPAAFSIILANDRKDFLEGNLLRFGNQRFWIAAREPATPDQNNHDIKVELRLDTGSRRQRRSAMSASYIKKTEDRMRTAMEKK